MTGRDTAALLLAALLSLDCGAQKMQTNGSEITIAEGAVAPLSGVRVGVGNIWERDYELPDRTTRRGPSAMLFLAGQDAAMVVGAGSVVRIGGATWSVVGVRTGTPRGEVRLVPIR